MNLKANLFSIFSLSLFSLGAWLVLLFNIDPTKNDLLTQLAFLSSLFLWLSGTITLIEYRIKVKLTNKELVYAPLPIAIRHGLLISLALVIILALQLLRVLNIFDTIIIIAIILTSELYFKARTHHA